jgi:hypothetical protein
MFFLRFRESLSGFWSNGEIAYRADRRVHVSTLDEGHKASLLTLVACMRSGQRRADT